MNWLSVCQMLNSPAASISFRPGWVVSRFINMHSICLLCNKTKISPTYWVAVEAILQLTCWYDFLWHSVCHCLSYADTFKFSSLFIVSRHFITKELCDVHAILIEMHYKQTHFPTTSVRMLLCWKCPMYSSASELTYFNPFLSETVRNEVSISYFLHLWYNK